MIGTTVGSYRITQKVSVGGMGTVYRAEHTLIGKQAAVKLLHPELCNNRDIVNRFFNEAKATTQIKHPGIVEVFDFGYLPSGHAYLVMEFLEGSSLAQRLELGDKMSEGEAAMILRAVCNALGAAHAKKIVHRDLKPDNIFLVPDPETATGIRPKILDFGIAKLTDIGPAGTATKTGSVMGTPTYMSPEQCRGTGEIDHRSDLYSLGCILYEIVCGQAPFVSDGAGELIGQHLFVEPEPPTKHNPGVSPEAEQLIMALLKKDPKQRPQTARELGQALDKLAQRAGWITRTSPTGITAQSLPDVGVPTPEPKVPSGTSLGVTPVAREPSRPIAAARPPTPTPPPAVPEPELPRKTMSPTTLSGAASSIIDVPRRRRGMVIGAVGLAGVAAAIVFFVMTSGGGKDTAAPKAASEPTPAAVPIAPSPPPPLPPPAPVEPPAAPPVPAPTPPAPTPPAPTPPPAHPTVVRPVRPRVVKPDVKPVKPDVKPTKPTSGTGSGSAKILIETDL